MGCISILHCNITVFHLMYIMNFFVLNTVSFYKGCLLVDYIISKKSGLECCGKLRETERDREGLEFLMGPLTDKFS